MGNPIAGYASRYEVASFSANAPTTSNVARTRKNLGSSPAVSQARIVCSFVSIVTAALLRFTSAAVKCS